MIKLYNVRDIMDIIIVATDQLTTDPAHLVAPFKRIKTHHLYKN